MYFHNVNVIIYQEHVCGNGRGSLFFKVMLKLMCSHSLDQNILGSIGSWCWSCSKQAHTHAHTSYYHTTLVHKSPIPNYMYNHTQCHNEIWNKQHPQCCYSGMPCTFMLLYSQKIKFWRELNLVDCFQRVVGWRI